ncbi:MULTISPECIES: DUF6438 domain-containing protein [unclassified Dyella]|jgi:hypothetical protein|uniref:DUF6438 domain-containing protein n=1 Tax=unclassified Dyella TaxID=2634549 RepID=UPI003F8E0290
MTAGRYSVAGMMKAACFVAMAIAIPSVAAANGADGVAITLARSACYGSCPAYNVTIHGDGLVQFTTGASPIDGVDALHRQFARSSSVLLPGTHEDKVRPEVVEALLKQFEAANFWHLKNAYRYPVTDGPTHIVTLVVGDRKKTVVDYMGTKAGMPQAVEDLEASIDRIAGTDRWVTGSPGLIPWLEQAGFDFHSNYAAALAVEGEMDDADEATVVAFIDRGAPLQQSVLPQGNMPGEPEVAGITLMESSIRRGHANLFKRLANEGWLDRLGKDKAAVVFASTAAGCSPAMVDAAADAGVDIDFSLPDESLDGSREKTALAALGNAYTCRQIENARSLTAARLLARGANPNHRDSLGRTPIYGVEDLELLNVLLLHGADASAKSNNGKSMVFGSWSDAIVLRLLEAGASPVGRYDYDGKTLAQEAKAQNMRQVTKWLLGHPEAFQR